VRRSYSGVMELSIATAIAVGAGGGAFLLLLLLLLVRAGRRRRAMSRRLASIAARLEGPGDTTGDDRDEVGRLERLAESAVFRLSDADAEAGRLAGALDAVSDGVVVCDEQGEVVFANEAADRLGPMGVDGAGPLSAAMVEALRAAMSGGDVPPVTRTVDVLGPPRRTVRVSGRALDDGRRVVGAVAVAQDVSEQRRLEVQRRDFLTNVTAELKAPVGALGLLAGTIVAEDDPVLTRRLAARLERDALAVGRVVDDLGELSRLDDEAVPDRHTVAVDLIVAQAVEEARAVLPHRTVVVDTAGAPAGLAVTGDRRQLVSALRHLVHNGLTFSDRDVRVVVTASPGWAEIAVVDTGTGIPDGDLDRIFECFFRGGAARRRAAGGTGVGLAIVARVAGAHGGDVVVSSEESKGSTFTLRLPAGAGAGAASGPAREAV
jgi:two-component system sensor histidine kinase SenX3